LNVVFYSTVSKTYERYIELARGLLILEAKAPFSSPVAGSGKPFLPSLTLPVNRDFFSFYLSKNLFNRRGRSEG
jgi:hypothetical protein